MSLRRIPSLNWLRVFEAAARIGSFARAAEALNMSPPAVSQQIRALEGHLGRPLFNRAPQRVNLTDAGRAFLPVVANALTSVEATAASLFGHADGEPLTVRVSFMLGYAWLTPRLPSFLNAHPSVRLTLVNGIVDEDFQRGGADLSITFGLPPGPGEEGCALFGETLSPVARRDIAERIATPEDLAAQTLIEVVSHRANWYRVLPEAGRDGPAPRFHYTDTTTTAFALAAAGLGVALARAPATDGLVARHGLMSCLPGYGIAGAERYYLVHGARLSRPAAAFRDWLITIAGADDQFS